MRTIINSLDNEKNYCSASVYGEYADTLTNQELIDRINSKAKRKEVPVRKVFIGADTQWFGPQRYAKDTGAFLEQTNEEGYWVDPISREMYNEKEGRFVKGEWIPSVIKSRYSEEKLPKKVRTELNSEESSWLCTHEQYIDPELDNDPIAKVSYDEEINDGEGHTIVDVVYCTDATEETLEEVRFWKRMVWLIGHSPKKALEFCKKHSNCEWLDVETKSWIWELIKEDDTPKFKYAKLLMLRAEKYLAIHEKPEYTSEVEELKCNYKAPVFNIKHSYSDWYGKKEEPLFTNFSWTRVPSYKYKEEFLYTLKGRMKGEEVSCWRVGKTRNWIASNNLSGKMFNLFIKYAEEQIKK